MNAWLMANGRVWVGRARGRFGGIVAAVSMHMIKPLRLGVIRLYVFVTNRPGGRETAVMANLAKVLFSETKQRRAVEFRVAAHVIIIKYCII